MEEAKVTMSKRINRKMLLELFILGLIACFIGGSQCEVTEVFAEAGSKAILPCKCSSSSSFPRAIVWSKADSGTVWRKEKTGLQYWGAHWTQKGTQRIQCPHFQFERGDYNLHISSVTDQDGGLYSCRITHGGQITKNTVMLRIMKVTISPPESLYKEDVSVTCDVTPWPNDAIVQWTLNDSPYEPSTATAIRERPQRVVREKGSWKTNGEWTCIVGFGEKEGRASANLIVRGFIKPSDSNSKVYAAVGSDVDFPCVLSPGLIPSSSIWEKMKPEYLLEMTSIPLPASFSSSSASSRPPWDLSARLKEVKPGDEGRYRCSATIDGKQLYQHIQLVVAKIEKSVVSKKKGSVSLTCHLTDITEVTDYEWVQVVYDVNGSQIARSTQKGKTLTLNNAPEESHGEWVCRFYGREGILGNVTHHVQLMSGLTGKKRSEASPNTALILGLSLLLLVLLLILAQMYKNHQRRKKIFQYPALETIVHAASNEREERERSREKK